MQTQKIAKVSEADFAKAVFESPLPTVVDFYADWCPPCRMVAPVLEQMSSEFEGKVRFVKVNVDDNPGLASRYGIMSIPTVMFFSGDKVRGSIVGAVPAAAYREKVESVLGRATGTSRVD